MQKSDKVSFGPVLVGLRGSGKSTIAPMVAERLAMEWVDSDQQIEKRAGLPIAELFRSYQAERFRKLEREVLLDLFQRPNCVLSFGGGAILHDGVRKILRARPTVWLHAEIEILAQRIAGSPRPSLTGKPIDEEIGEVFRSRKELFEEIADYKVDTGRLTPTLSAEAICKYFWSREGLLAREDADGV